VNTSTGNSIARRLAWMFALAAALVFMVIGSALYTVQRMELRRHQFEEVRIRFEYMQQLISRRIFNQTKWQILEDKLNELSPPDRSVLYLIQSDDPLYRYGTPFEASAKVSREADGIDRVDLSHDRTYLALSAEIPALGERPAVRLTVAADPHSFDTTKRILRISLVGFSLLGVAAIAGLGWWIARRSLAAVDDLSRHAAELSPQNLAERLPANNLPSELNGLVLSFNGALERVEQAYLQLSTFNADVAHELRTPLGNLIGQTQVILSRERSGEELKEVLESNLEELERLRSIINDMLFLARADRGLRVETLSLASIAGEVAATAEYLDILIEEAGVSLQIEGDAEAPIERSLFRRAITNLLYNAIQHGARNSEINIRIEDMDNGVSIQVSNHGEPIEPHHLERLFDRFYRVDASRTDSENSHGLGLAIVKAVAVMHGGTVFARSEADLTTIGLTVAHAKPPGATFV